MDYFDKVGVKIKSGDFVVFCVGGQSDTNVRFGVVDSIKRDSPREYNNGPIIKPYPKGKKLQQPRKDDEIIVMNKFKVDNAEFFI